MIDLHSHTTASDGEHAPRTLVALAKQAGVTRLAVTDHDTVGGLAEALEAGRELGVEVICGIEVSTEIERVDIHVLGHFVDPRHPQLLAYTGHQQGERRRRMEGMVRKLNAMGLPVRMERVDELAGSENLCRPHLARALVELGVCTSMQDAFNRYIGDGGPAFVAQERLSAKDAIALIHACGGTATIAHPQVDGMEKYHLKLLAAAGLDGVEVFHPDHNPSTREKYLRIAAALNLVPTAGSDFHGGDTAPDRGLGTANLELRYFEALRLRAATVA